MHKLEKLGFVKNTKTINGFRPNYIKDNKLVFVFNKSYWLGRIVSLGWAYRNSPYTIIGILTEDSPSLAAFDWVIGQGSTLLTLNPLSKVVYNKETQQLDYVPITEI